MGFLKEYIRRVLNEVMVWDVRNNIFNADVISYVPYYNGKIIYKEVDNFKVILNSNNGADYHLKIGTYKNGDADYSYVKNDNYSLQKSKFVYDVFINHVLVLIDDGKIKSVYFTIHDDTHIINRSKLVNKILNRVDKNKFEISNYEGIITIVKR